MDNLGQVSGTSVTSLTILGVDPTGYAAVALQWNVRVGGSVTPNTPSGVASTWSQATSRDDTQNVLQRFDYVGTGLSAGDIVCSVSAGTMEAGAVIAWGLTDAEAADLIDASGTADTGATDTNNPSVSISATGAGKHVMGFGCSRTGDMTTPGTGFTLKLSAFSVGAGGSNLQSWAVEKDVDTTGAGSVTVNGTLASSREWIIAGIAFNPAAAGGATLERSATISATSAATVSAYQREHLRQAAVTAAAAIAAAPQRDLQRTATLDASSAIAATGEHVAPRAATLTATTAVEAAHERELNRQATLTAAAAITVTGVVEGAATVVERTAALAATASVTVTAYQRDHQRQAGLTATTAVTAAGEVDGVITRSASLNATAAATVSAYERELQRGAALTAATLIEAAYQRDINRAISLSATAAISSVGQIGEIPDVLIFLAYREPEGPTHREANAATHREHAHLTLR